MKRKRNGKVEKVSVGNVVVRIYTRATSNGYKAHEVADYTTGTRRLRSFSDHGAARTEALKLARLLASGESTAARMRGPDAASYGRAVELLRGCGVPVELAAAHFAEAFKILGSGRIVEAAKFFKAHNTENLPQRTVAEVVAELLAAKEARGASVRYLADLRARLNRFAAAFKVNIASVSTADVQKWFDGLKCATQTLKNFRTVLHTLFEFAEARGYIHRGANPVAATESVSVRGGDAVQIYSASEVAKLLEAAPDAFKPCLSICAFAGLRSAEVERLDWQDVDLAGGFITVTAAMAKTRSRRLVPVPDNLKAWLAPHARKSGPVWNAEHDHFYDAQQATAKAAGVPWKANGLRHSFASYRLAQTQNAAQVALECGNSPGVVFKHYRELVKPSQAAAWFAVGPDAPVNVVAMEAGA